MPSLSSSNQQITALSSAQHAWSSLLAALRIDLACETQQRSSPGVAGSLQAVTCAHQRLHWQSSAAPLHSEAPASLPPLPPGGRPGCGGPACCARCQTLGCALWSEYLPRLHRRLRLPDPPVRVGVTAPIRAAKSAVRRTATSILQSLAPGVSSQELLAQWQLV